MNHYLKQYLQRCVIEPDWLKLKSYKSQISEDESSLKIDLTLERQNAIQVSLVKGPLVFRPKLKFVIITRQTQMKGINNRDCY